MLGGINRGAHSKESIYRITGNGEKIKMKRRKRQIEKAKKKQKYSKRAQIHRILDLVMDRNNGGNTTFFEFNGHVNGISIYLHEGKWSPTNPASVTMNHYLDCDCGYSLDKLEAALCGK